MPTLDGSLLHHGELAEKLSGASDLIEKFPGLEELLLDKWNAEQLDLVRPKTYSDPDPKGGYDLVAIGGGAGGLITAIIASLVSGKRCALIERNALGGDCLNTGCVPSKALLQSAKVAHYCQTSEQYGVKTGEVSSDFGAVMERVRKLRSRVSHHDSVERMAKAFKLEVFLGEATFKDDKTVTVNGQDLPFDKACIATGGRPFVPPVPGVDSIPYFTSESIFNLTEKPSNLLIIGAGPIGCELGQAF